MEAEKPQIFASLINNKPEFKGLISEISVNATFLEERGELLDTSSFEYTSPVATDTENHEISLQFNGQAGK